MSHKKDDDDEEEDVSVRDKTCVSLLPLRSSAHTPNRLQPTVTCNTMHNVHYSALHSTLYNRTLQCDAIFFIVH